MSFKQTLEEARRDQVFASLIREVPYASYLGINMLLKDGCLQFELPYAEKLVGNYLLPAVHGGVVAGFMENSAMLHILFNLDQNRLPKTINFSIDYLRPAGPQTTWCRCEVNRKGRRVANVQTYCWQDDEARPVAIGRVHILLEDLQDT